ncbi:MAG: DUF2945 domain-containing protein [Planctomycetota bacterium]
MVREGTRVRWEWGSGTAEGNVEERHTKSVTREIDGSEVTRNGSEDDPALIIKQDDGQTVVKLLSEVERADES